MSTSRNDLANSARDPSTSSSMKKVMTVSNLRKPTNAPAKTIIPPGQGVERPEEAYQSLLQVTNLVLSNIRIYKTRILQGIGAPVTAEEMSTLTKAEYTGNHPDHLQKLTSLCEAQECINSAFRFSLEDIVVRWKVTSAAANPDDSTIAKFKAAIDQKNQKEFSLSNELRTLEKKLADQEEQYAKAIHRLKFREDAYAAKNLNFEKEISVLKEHLHRAYRQRGWQPPTDIEMGPDGVHPRAYTPDGDERDKSLIFEEFDAETPEMFALKKQLREQEDQNSKMKATMKEMEALAAALQLENGLLQNKLQREVKTSQKFKSDAMQLSTEKGDLETKLQDSVEEVDSLKAALAQWLNGITPQEGITDPSDLYEGAPAPVNGNNTKTDPPQANPRNYKKSVTRMGQQQPLSPLGIPTPPEDDSVPLLPQMDESFNSEPSPGPNRDSSFPPQKKGLVGVVTTLMKKKSWIRRAKDGPEGQNGAKGLASPTSMSPTMSPTRGPGRRASVWDSPRVSPKNVGEAVPLVAVGQTLGSGLPVKSPPLQPTPDPDMESTMKNGNEAVTAVEDKNPPQDNVIYTQVPSSPLGGKKGKKASANVTFKTTKALVALSSKKENAVQTVSASTCEKEMQTDLVKQPGPAPLRKTPQETSHQTPASPLGSPRSRVRSEGPSSPTVPKKSLKEFVSVATLTDRIRTTTNSTGVVTDREVKQPTWSGVNNEAQTCQVKYRPDISEILKKYSISVPLYKANSILVDRTRFNPEDDVRTTYEELCAAVMLLQAQGDLSRSQADQDEDLQKLRDEQASLLQDKEEASAKMVLGLQMEVSEQKTALREMTKQKEELMERLTQSEQLVIVTSQKAATDLRMESEISVKKLQAVERKLQWKENELKEMKERLERAIEERAQAVAAAAAAERSAAASAASAASALSASLAVADGETAKDQDLLNQPEAVGSHVEEKTNSVSVVAMAGAVVAEGALMKVTAEEPLLMTLPPPVIVTDPHNQAQFFALQETLTEAHKVQLNLMRKIKVLEQAFVMHKEKIHVLETRGGLVEYKNRFHQKQDMKMQETISSIRSTHSNELASLQHKYDYLQSKHSTYQNISSLKIEDLQGRVRQLRSINANKDSDRATLQEAFTNLLKEHEKLRKDYQSLFDGYMKAEAEKAFHDEDISVLPRPAGSAVSVVSQAQRQAFFWEGGEVTTLQDVSSHLSSQQLTPEEAENCQLVRKMLDSSQADKNPSPISLNFEDPSSVVAFTRRATKDCFRYYGDMHKILTKIAALEKHEVETPVPLASSDLAQKMQQQRDLELQKDTGEMQSTLKVWHTLQLLSRVETSSHDMLLNLRRSIRALTANATDLSLGEDLILSAPHTDTSPVGTFSSKVAEALRAKELSMRQHQQQKQFEAERREMYTPLPEPAMEMAPSATPGTAPLGKRRNTAQDMPSTKKKEPDASPVLPLLDLKATAPVPLPLPFRTGDSSCTKAIAVPPHSSTKSNFFPSNRAQNKVQLKPVGNTRESTASRGAPVLLGQSIRRLQQQKNRVCVVHESTATYGTPPPTAPEVGMAKRVDESGPMFPLPQGASYVDDPEDDVAFGNVNKILTNYKKLQKTVNISSK